MERWKVSVLGGREPGGAGDSAIMNLDQDHKRAIPGLPAAGSNFPLWAGDYD
jgi:hypothetical protein